MLLHSGNRDKDDAREKQILQKLREIEREANNQLPHVLKIAAPRPAVTQTPSVKIPETQAKTPPAKAKTPPAKPKTPPAKAKTAPPKAKTVTKGKAKKK